MCFCPYSYHHQHCQSVSLLRSVPSYSQRIYYLPTSQETHSRQRPTLKVPSNLQPVSHIENNRTCCKIATYWSPFCNGFLNNIILASLLTASITQLKHPYCISVIISSMSCRLDLSAAFNTIDHNILITRLSS